MNEIKRQLNMKIGDTSDRVARVQQLVHEKKMNQQETKKIHWPYYATIVTFIGVLAFCIYLIPNALNKEEGRLTEQDPPSQVVPSDKDDEDVEELGGHYEQLKQYFFDDETVAIFQGGHENRGYTVETFWLSNRYVQQTVRSHNRVNYIYRITNNEIELVNEMPVVGAGPANIPIKDLDNMTSIRTILKAPFQVGDTLDGWKISDTAGEITTTYGKLTNVLVMEKLEDDVHWKKYYAPGFGEVKSENNYVESELVSIGPYVNPLPVITLKNTLTDEKKSVDAENFPELQQYILDNHDWETDLQPIPYIELSETDNSATYSVVSPECMNEVCSKWLLKETSNGGGVVEIGSDMVDDTVEFSPNNLKVLLRFTSDEEGTVRNRLAIIDLQEMKIIMPSQNSMYFEEVTWPIVEYGWVDDQTVAFKTADIHNAMNITIKKWVQAGKQPVKDVTVKLR